eukprot:TRINITY_DN20872_c0_g1_i5.p1 TRINITY_DN20872_c0_g1~~TRINITY_DN20872_c0_g1_i5.p1  ORF type:complete len:181 (+),score=11.20 TRINITY_DN20872_c0_g1_i5:197-739(+)
MRNRRVSNGFASRIRRCCNKHNSFESLPKLTNSKTENSPFEAFSLNQSTLLIERSKTIMQKGFEKRTIALKPNISFTELNFPDNLCESTFHYETTGLHPSSALKTYYQLQKRKNVKNYLRYDKSMNSRKAMKFMAPRKIVFVPRKSFSTDFDHTEHTRNKKLGYTSINYLLTSQHKRIPP